MGSTMEESGLNFKITGDNSNILAKINNVRAALDELVKNAESSGRAMENVAEESGDAIDALAGKMKTAAAAVGLAFGAKELIGNIVKVRGEFQQLEMAFNTMLGSEERATALMSQLVKTAATTPFDLQGVANGAKQLLAYGTSAEEVNDTLIRCGDVAAGLSIPLNDLVYLYGTTMTQGRMFTQDLRQFQGRGIPIAEELSKVLGTTTDKLGELVTAGRVTSDVFKEAFMNMTSEGSKFGGLMDAQSQTITGQISNIEDAIDMMFNDLGQQSEGVINAILNNVSYVVEHYEQFGRMLTGLVATYGTYKTAVMATVAVQNLQTLGVKNLTLAERAHYAWIVLTEKAQKLLNSTMLKNPYVAVATAVAGLIAYIVSLKNETELLKEAEEDYGNNKRKLIEDEQEHKRRIEELIGVAHDESLSTESRKMALIQLEKQYPSIFAKYDTEYEKLKNIKKIKEEIAEFDNKKSISNSKNELGSVEGRIKLLEKKQKTEVSATSKDQYGNDIVSKIGGLTDKEKAELKMLLGKRTHLKSQVTKDAQDAYLANLTGVSNTDLSKEIRVRENLLAKMKVSEKKYGTITGGNPLFEGTYNQSQLEFQINKFRDELNKRTATRKSSVDWTEDAKKKWQDAQKKYVDFINSRRNDITAEDFEKTAAKYKEEADALKKAYDSISDKSKKTAKSGESDEQRKSRIEQALKAEQDIIDENAKALRRQEEDLQYEANKAKYDAMEDGYAKERSLRSLENQKSLRDLEREKEDAVASAKKRVQAEFDAQEKVRKSKNKSYAEKIFNWDKNATDEQKKQIADIADFYADMIETQRKVNQKEDDADIRKQKEALNEYLKQYGDFQQKKSAIELEYDEKIKKAQTNGERFSIEAEKERVLSELATAEMKDAIDWESVFSDLDNVSVEYLRKLKLQLKDLLSAKDITADNAKVIAEQMSKIDSQIISKKQEWKSVFGIAIPELEKMCKLEKDAVDAQNAMNDAMNTYNDSLRDTLLTRQTIAELLNNNGIQAKTSDITTQNSQEYINRLSSLGKDTSGLTALFSTLATQERFLAKNTKNLSKATTEQQTATAKAAKSLSSTVAIIEKISSIINQNVQSSVKLIDTLQLSGTQFGKGFSSFADGVQNASDAFNSFKSGDFIGATNGVLGTLKSLGDAFGEWGIAGFGSSDTRLKEDVERLTASNENLQKSIDLLSDMMEDANSLSDIDELAKKQEKYLEQSIKNTQEMMKREGAVYSNGFLGIGGKKSSNYQIDKHLTSEEWKRISDIVGHTVTNASDFWNLTSEQMAKVAANAGDVYDRIKQYADDGKGDAAQYMDAYIAYYKKREELENKYRESITSISFDSIKSEFESLLTDMDTEASDFSDNFEKMLRNAIVNAMLKGEFEERLKDWYAKFSDSLSDDNTVSSSEKDALKKEYDELTGDLRKKRDELFNALGLDSSSSQSGTSKGFSAMTQDQAEELNGRFTALQATGQQVGLQVTSIVTKLDASLALDTLRNTFLLEITNLINRTNSFLEDILDGNKKIRIEFGDKMDRMITKLNTL